MSQPTTPKQRAHRSLRDLTATLCSSDVLFLGLFWIIATVCNLTKPFHIDDTAHLEIARWISAHPFRPMSGMLNWNGTSEPIWKTNQPHLYFYIIAVWGAIFGYSEIAMHALQSFSALACIMLFHQLAREFAPTRAVWLTAMFALGPAFLVSQNVMVDVPLLACWLAVFNALLLGTTSAHQTRRYVIAAVACSAALLIKYSSLVLLPILTASLILEQRMRQSWTLLIPLATLVVWSAFNILDYGGIHILSRSAGSSDHLRPIKFAIAWVLIIGAVMPLGLVSVMQWRALRCWEWIVYPATVAFLMLLCLAVGCSWVSEAASDKILWVAFAANGLFFLANLAPAFAELRVAFYHRINIADRREGNRLAIILLWILGTGVFYLLFPAFSATRHVLLIVPALLLLFAVRSGQKLSLWAMRFALGLTVLVSGGLALSDYAFAHFYSSTPGLIRAKLGSEMRVWTSGHWGWQWYSTKAGFHQVDYRQTHFAAGDIFVEAPDIDHQYPTSRLSLTPLWTEVQERQWASLFCTARRWQFYMSSSRFGPWSLSRKCLGHVTVYRVNAPYP